MTKLADEGPWRRGMMRHDNSFLTHAFTKFARDEVPRFDVLAIGIYRLELRIGHLRELDLLVVVHSASCVGHRDLRIASEEPEIGPQRSADEGDVVDLNY